jgi:putative membrane protein
VEYVRLLPHLNALLNSIATALLIWGYVLIRQRREQTHRRVMLACFGVSVLFLTSYLIYHFQVHSVRFPSYPPPVARYFYYTILITHVILAALVPFLAIASIVLGLRDRRTAHRRVSRWTFPIWLYVSVTGVLVYLMLYQIYPPQEEAVKMNQEGLSAKRATVSALGAAWHPTVAVGASRNLSRGELARCES